MLYLNNVPDGGTEFKYQNIITPAVKGNLIIWPADFTHTHKGVISKTKEKYIATGWFKMEHFHYEKLYSLHFLDSIVLNLQYQLLC